MTNTQIKQVIGQQEASIDKVEDFLTDEEFKEYCDAIAVTVTYWRLILKKKKE
jgi:hypothetical protein